MVTLATVVSPMIEPDESAIKTHLDQLCEPARWDYPDGLVEICHGPATNPASLAALFSVSEAGVAEAVKYAISVNRRGENTYVGVNPRKRNTNPGKRAADRDVEISFFHFADLDEKDAVERARYGLPLRPTMFVMTGTEPHNRPHFYWRLTEPTMNLVAWTERQRGIAQSLGGDAVVNPSRLMRLAGTVNFPLQHKVERGYRVELTTIKTSFSTERPFVTPEQVSSVYPLQKQSSDEAGQLAAGETTLSAMAHKGVSPAAYLDRIRAGDRWHENSRDLVAHWIGVGWCDAEIMAVAPSITLSGFTVDDTEKHLRSHIDTARRKFMVPDPDVEVREAEAGDSLYETLTLAQIKALPAQTYLIDGILPEHGFAACYGPPGSCKSFITIDMTLRLAFKMDWHGIETKQCGVLYIAGEGRHGIGKRVDGWLREHGLSDKDAPFRLLPVAVHMLDKPSIAKLKRTITAMQEEVDFNISVVVIDTISRSIPGHDENKQDAMSLFVDGCAEIQNHTNGAVIGVHHCGKDIDRGMRGSSVLLGGVDASILIVRDDRGQVELTVEKQKDDEEAAPIFMAMRKVEWSPGGLEKQVSTLVPFLVTEAEKLPEKTLSVDEADRIFRVVNEGWTSVAPWSVAPQSKRRGRYLPDYITEHFGVGHDSALSYIMGWQQRDYLRLDLCDPRNKVSGLRVIKYLER